MHAYLRKTTSEQINEESECSPLTHYNSSTKCFNSGSLYCLGGHNKKSCIVLNTHLRAHIQTPTHLPVSGVSLHNGTNGLGIWSFWISCSSRATCFLIPFCSLMNFRASNCRGDGTHGTILTYWWGKYTLGHPVSFFSFSFPAQEQHRILRKPPFCYHFPVLNFPSA